jgi:primase-polymerase (primpol)-like protein
MDYETANVMATAAHLSFGGDFRVGFVLTSTSKIFVIDIDSAAMPDGQWHPLVKKLRAILPLAAFEVSTSGTGLHGWGRYTGDEPEHGCVATMEGIKLELYTSGRFIALGDQTTVIGDAGADSTTELHQLIASYFPQWPPAASPSGPPRAVQSGPDQPRTQS